ncbi:hypothetical protein jhhlp_006540 [Lomentospora prolificans]|uniref:Glycoside hydrolase family 5 domain-containing protein n=1 Tax=Lomentospora prolificans TaxID=41688 RepID=A0A2N3N660_9PEZI|nr:hypothetical protein jhhlp_006540 [Lomentospora prolificans]
MRFSDYFPVPWSKSRPSLSLPAHQGDEVVTKPTKGWRKMAILIAVAVALFFVLIYRLRASQWALSVPWIPDPASLAFTKENRLPPASDLAPPISSYSLPLSTQGRDIVDARGKRVKLASVNWYGASDELFVSGGLDVKHRDEIARLIRKLGFNSVRLPYSDELVIENPVVRDEDVAANPDLIGKTALDVFTATVKSLTKEGVAVIVNNHITRASWCDGFDLCDAAWSNDHLGPFCKVRQTEEEWIQHWETIMEPLVSDPYVIGVDLRNEVRGLWGTMSWAKWAAAAEKCGDRLLAMNPDWLVVVGGISSGNDLSGAATRPVRLSVARDRVVYSSHSYSWSGWGEPWKGMYAKRNYESFVSTVRRHWGYLLENDIAPVWVGEFGAPGRPGVGDARYWRHLVRYLTALDADFGYWALNPRKVGLSGSKEETYGLVREDWETPVLDYRMKDMIGLMKVQEPNRYRVEDGERREAEDDVDGKAWEL